MFKNDILDDLVEYNDVKLGYVDFNSDIPTVSYTREYDAQEPVLVMFKFNSYTGSMIDKANYLWFKDNYEELFDTVIFDSITPFCNSLVFRVNDALLSNEALLDVLEGYGQYPIIDEEQYDNVCTEEIRQSFTESYAYDFLDLLNGIIDTLRVSESTQGFIPDDWPKLNLRRIDLYPWVTDLFWTLLYDDNVNQDLYMLYSYGGSVEIDIERLVTEHRNTIVNIIKNEFGLQKITITVYKAKVGQTVSDAQKTFLFCRRIVEKLPYYEMYVNSMKDITSQDKDAIYQRFIDEVKNQVDNAYDSYKFIVNTYNTNDRKLLDTFEYSGVKHSANKWLKTMLNEIPLMYLTNKHHIL